MTTIHAAADGTILRVVQTAADEQLFGTAPPSGATQTVRFDAATNGATLADLNATWNRYTVGGGQLLRDGQAVPLAAAGTAAAEREDMLATGQTALANLTAYLGLATPTAAQTTAVVQLLCRVARFLLRRALAS